jgi:hypothetical protein
MKGPQTLSITLLSVLALGAFIATPAHAEVTLLAEWLANGAQVTVPLSTSTSDELLLEETKGQFGMPFIFKCSVIFDGTITTDGAGETTKILTLTGAEGFQCVRATGSACEEASEVTLTGLPILTQIFLMEDGKFLELLTAGSGKLGFLIKCLILGSLLINVECITADAENEVVNAIGGVEEPGEQTPPYLCNRGSEGGEATETGLVTALMSLTTLVESSLSVSSE